MDTKSVTELIVLGVAALVVVFPFARSIYDKVVATVSSGKNPLIIPDPVFIPSSTDGAWTDSDKINILRKMQAEFVSIKNDRGIELVNGLIEEYFLVKKPVAIATTSNVQGG